MRPGDRSDSLGSESLIKKRLKLHRETGVTAIVTDLGSESLIKKRLKPWHA